jgi:Glycosyltransferase family 87
LEQRLLDDRPTACRTFRLWLRSTRTQVLLGLALALSVWGWFDVRVRGTVDPNSAIHKTDFTVYTEAGAAFFDGRDPYKVTNPRGWGYLYPPLFAILVSPLHHLAPENQVSVWFVVSVLTAWGCYRESLRIARVVLPDSPDGGWFGPVPTPLACAALAAAIIPTLNCLQRGQVGLAKLYLLLLGFRLLIESRSIGRSFLAGTVLAVSIVLKLTPLVPVAVVLFQELLASWRAGRAAAVGRASACSAGTIVGLVMCLFIIPSCLVGWSANWRHLNSWYRWVAASSELKADDSFSGDGTSVRNQSFTNAANHFGNWIERALAGTAEAEAPQRPAGRPARLMETPRMAGILSAIRMAAAALVVLLAIRMAWALDPLARAVGFGLACVSTLILAPIARGHYYMLMFPAVLFPAVWLLRAGRPRTAKTLAAVPGVLVIGHYAAIGVMGEIGWLGLGTTLWFTATVAVILHAERSASKGQLASGPSGIQPTLDRPLAA